MKPDGGPAFPFVLKEHGAGEPGMTLRDYFAIHSPEPTKESVNVEAEKDRLANPHGDTYKPRRRSQAEIVAALRYAYADAMLEALKRCES